jgi:hypothetical protein
LCTFGRKNTMPRIIQVSVSPDIADALLKRLDGVSGLIGLSRTRGAALQPPGDVLSIQVTNDATRAVFALLEDLRVHESGSIATSDPRCMVAPGHRKVLDRESNETVWDEMAFLLRQDTNLAFNYLGLMFLAGAIAAAGLWADMLHIVIGAMVVAPGFEPLVRLPFGVIAARSELATRGALSTAAGYAMIALGGAVTLVVLRLVDPSADPDISSRQWVQYWSSFTAPGIVNSVLAAAAGAIVISGLRSVLTTGVMIALALIPSMTIVGMALVSGDLALMRAGFARWLADAGFVILLSAVIFGYKQATLHRRRAVS